MNYKFFIILFIFLSVSIIIHESIHYTIFKYDGCQNINFGVNKVLIYTTCSDSNYVWSDWSKLAHSINEIIGYSFIWFFSFLYIILRGV